MGNHQATLKFKVSELQFRPCYGSQHDPFSPLLSHQNFSPLLFFIHRFCLLQLSTVRRLPLTAGDAWFSCTKRDHQEIILRNQAVFAAVRAQNWPRALRILQEAMWSQAQMGVMGRKGDCQMRDLPMVYTEWIEINQNCIYINIDYLYLLNGMY